MSVHPDDEKWAAYVLDELDPVSRGEVEREMADSPIVRQEIESIREGINLLQQGLGTEPQFRLTQEQIEQLLEETEGTAVENGTEMTQSGLSDRSAGKTFCPPGWVPWIQGIAALVFLSSILMFGLHEHRQEALGLAQRLGSEGERSKITSPIPSTERPGPETLAAADGGSGGRIVENGSDSNKGREPVGLQAASTIPVSTSSALAGSPSSPVYSQPFVTVANQPRVECSINVDPQGYGALRRSVWEGVLPTEESVRVDELINHFSYDYESPQDGQPLVVRMEAGTCPWNARHRLVQIGLKGASADPSQKVRVILLVDGVEVRRSGFNRALLLQALTSLRHQLKPLDELTVIDGSRLGGPIFRVASAEPSATVLERLLRLPPGGSIDIGVSNSWVLTKVVAELDESARNEVVIIAGSSEGERVRERMGLIGLIRETGNNDTSVSVVGIQSVGPVVEVLGPAPDDEGLRYQNIDSLAQANYFWKQLLKRRNPIVARQVKMHLEFNAETVLAYRELGRVIRGSDRFETVQLMGEDFQADHEVTALFEVIPITVAVGADNQPTNVAVTDLPERNTFRSQNMLTVKLNYRLASENQRVREVYPFVDRGATLGESSEDFKFSASVAAYGLWLSDAPFRGTINHYGILELAQKGLGDDSDGSRAEFLELVKRTLKIILHRGGRVRG